MKNNKSKNNCKQMDRIKQLIHSVIIGHTTPFREIKYFHPNGNTMPNGSHYQRGGFINECKINKDNFILNEEVHGEQYGIEKYKGGIVVFPADINVVDLNNRIVQLVDTGAYSVGNSFKGQFVGDNGEKYNDKSPSVEINGVSSKNLLLFAEMLAQDLMQKSVLVKDLNLDKIYMADNIHSR